MTCGSCSSSVESALKQLPGVQQASVSLITGLAEVTYNGNTTGAWCLFMMVWWACCQIGRVCQRLPGVQQAGISLITGLAEVTYNSNTTGAWPLFMMVWWACCWVG